MKRLLALMLCAVSLGVGAQTEYPYPYNPDGNNDGFINLSDLLDLLAIYSTEFSAGVLTTDSTSAIFYTGQMDYWDCASSCVSLTGNWKVLDKNLVGTYKSEINSNTPNDIAWLDASHSFSQDGINGVNTSGWQEAYLLYNDLRQCYCQTRTRADIDEINLCEGQEDECGVCNGPGAVYECGCSDIPEGDCDCEGNQLDAIGVCGGDCLEDADGDGVCDPVFGPCEGEEFVTYHGIDYAIAEIDDKCWFAQDLATSSYNDGTPLEICGDFNSTPFGSVKLQDGCGSTSASYNHIAVSNPFQNVCPVGWRVANYGDYSSLVNLFGGTSSAGAFLKSIEAGGNNLSGFNAQCRDIGFCDESQCGSLTSVRYRTSLTSGANNYFMLLSSGDVSATIQTAYTSNDGAIRCIKD